MGFSSSFQQGLSGLTAAQRGLEVIANNVSNSSVVGFKSSTASFADVFARAFNGGDSINNIGLGTSLSAVTQNFKQGNITVTGSPLDLAINGTGFFKTQAPDGSFLYTRNGQFNLDNSNVIVNTNGDKLTGYPIDQTTGKVTDVAGTITVSKAAIEPSASTATSLETNLDARQDPIAAAVTFDPANLSSYNNSTSMTVYDELGNSHTMSIYLRKESTNNWSAYAALDGTQVDVGLSPVTATTAPAQSAAGALAFNADGSLVTPGNAKFEVDLSRYVTSAGVPFSSTGTTPNKFTFDLSKTTQYGSSFAIQNLSQDGYASSPFAGFNVGADGVLAINYANGQTKNIAKVGLYKFNNPEALQPVGSNGWKATEAAGPELVSLSDDTAFGTIQSGALEESNVDLTAELVAMISAQRVYQANSQSIKTQDSLLQTITNLR